jgi:hypothetical protein
MAEKSLPDKHWFSAALRLLAVGKDLVAGLWRDGLWQPPLSRVTWQRSVTGGSRNGICAGSWRSQHRQSFRQTFPVPGNAHARNKLAGGGC